MCGAEAAAEANRSRFGRYIVTGELGRGGMAIVYRAFDPVHGREVALKALPTVGPTSLARFKREFRVMAELDHPHVVKLFELTSDGETWFFTMEVVDGRDFLSYVQGGPARTAAERTPDTLAADGATQPIADTVQLTEVSEEQLQRLRGGLVQLAQAIAALHAKGIVHRDIKPSNVLVTAEGRVVLLDFGLIAETDSSGIHLSRHQELLGTVPYMSPEQAACDSIGAASDWYSVGVMLYQMLTGRLPFAGKVLDVLARKLDQDPVPPRELRPSLPQDLSDLCMALLCRRPEDRPQANEVLARLGTGDVLTAATKTEAPSKEALIGRDQEMQALRRSYQAVLDGEAQVVFVHGRSGEGKSALAEAFLEQAGRAGAVVLKGRCYEMESVPFKALDSLIDSLVDYLQRLSPAEAQALMPRDFHALARLFPVLGRVEALPARPRRPIGDADQHELNRRALGALRDLLARIGDRAPLVVYIDDLQWGDEDSAAMVADLLQPPDPPVLLLLGTCRSEDVETSPFWQTFRKIRRQRETPLASRQIELQPLAAADAEALALTLLPPADLAARRWAAAIARESAGNPYFIAELVKQLTFGADPVTPAAAPSSALADMIWSRVQRLPEDAQRLLAVVALRGRPLALDQALRIADVEQSALGPLRAGHLIRTVGLASSPRIETYHDRVREAVSQSLDRAAKRSHHARIAEELARQAPLDAAALLVHFREHYAGGTVPVHDPLEVASAWYDVAVQWDAAERSDLSFPYALATAEQARTQSSLEVAEQQFRIAERGVERAAPTLRRHVAEGLADVLMLRGKYAEAEQQLETARTLTTERDARARLEGKRGELAFKRGNNQAAAAALEQALHLLARRVPANAVTFLLALAWEAGVQALHTLFPARFLGRRRLQQAQEELLAVRLYIRLSYVYFFERGTIPCLWAHLRAINLAERYPPTRELGHAWAIHAPVIALVPWLSRAEEFAQRSLAVRQALDDLWGQAQSLSYWGVVLSIGSRFDDCIHKCTAAIELFERAGDYWEAHIARWFLADALCRQGELARALDEAQRLYAAADEMGDDKASGLSLDVWARASGGQLPASITQREMQRERHDVTATVQVLLAEGLRLLGQKDFAGAVETLARALELCARVHRNDAWVSPIMPWFATAQRLHWQQQPAGTRRRQPLNEAYQTACRALRLAKKFRNDLPHALREVGVISALRGAARRARKCLDQSLKVAEQQGAKFERAQTLLTRGRVGLTLNWPRAAAEIAEAEQALHELGADFALALSVPGE